MIDEGGGEAVLLPAMTDIQVFRTRIAEVGGVKTTISREPLGLADADGVASLSAGANAYPSRHVLSEINDMTG